MKITTEFLNSKKACKEGIVWFENQKETELVRVLQSLNNDDHWEWANWLIVRAMTRRQYLAYEIFAAEQVIDIWEKKHPDDARPRQAIDATKAVLKDDTIENRELAANVALAAANVAFAAYHGYAVAFAAHAAANAANAAYSAGSAKAAMAAVYSANAADGVGRKEVKENIFNYGIKIIEENL